MEGTFDATGIATLELLSTALYTETIGSVIIMPTHLIEEMANKIISLEQRVKSIESRLEGSLKVIPV